MGNGGVTPEHKLLREGSGMAIKGSSFRHGTVEGHTTHKCDCINCVNAYRESIGELPLGTPRLKESQPPMTVDNSKTPEFLTFLHSARFNELTIDILNGEWVAAIKAYGDKFIGYGVTPDYALFAAIKRYYSSDPNTGPITMTVNQATNETSEGNGLDDTGEIRLDNIWSDSSEEK